MCGAAEAAPFQGPVADFEIPQPLLAGPLGLLQTDRAIAGVNRDQVSAAIDLSVDVFLTQPSIDR